jgi:hypothetical protein
MANPGSADRTSALTNYSLQSVLILAMVACAVIVVVKALDRVRRIVKGEKFVIDEPVVSSVTPSH